MRKIGLLVAAAAITLSGCGVGSNDDVREAAASPIASPSTTVAPSPSPSPTPIPTPEATPAEEIPIAEKYLYRMRSNYDIAPIDPETTDKQVVLLTFDDGPKEEAMLNDMIDSLAKHDAKAIFFVNGFRVEQNPDLLKKLYEAGHTIGNHSWDHVALGKEEPASVDEQITKVQTIVEELTGEAPRFFRPPFASSSDYVKQKAKEEGLLFMTWSNGSLDWDRNNQTADKVIANVMEQLRPGSNILMHELPWTAEALDELLTQLEEAGYGFVDPNRLDHAWPE